MDNQKTSANPARAAARLPIAPSLYPSGLFRLAISSRVHRPRPGWRAAASRAPARPCPAQPAPCRSPLPAFSVLLLAASRSPVTLAPLLLLFEGESGLSFRSLVDGARGRFLRLWAFRLAGGFRWSAAAKIGGQSACSLKGRLVPTGRLRTTAGFCQVAAMTSGSWLSFAAPWWKRLLSAPHASRTALMEGAAIARSKKPSDVW